MALTKGNRNHLIHGMSGTRLHHIWKSMKQRCNNPKCVSYKNYGAKGITVCEEWKSFQIFMEWALNNGYDDNLTLDRINPYEGYCPSNCRWATYQEQGNNKTNNRIISFNGESKTMTEWSRKIGISDKTLHARLKSGWNVERALTTPLIKY